MKSKEPSSIRPGVGRFRLRSDFCSGRIQPDLCRIAGRNKKPNQSPGAGPGPGVEISGTSDPVSRKVTGTRTVAGVPGSNRQRRNAFRTERSRMELPVLCTITTRTTEPVRRSTVRRAIPLPVIWRLRAWYGYSGRGALKGEIFPVPDGTVRIGSVRGGQSDRSSFSPRRWSRRSLGNEFRRRNRLGRRQGWLKLLRLGKDRLWILDFDIDSHPGRFREAGAVEGDGMSRGQRRDGFPWPP